MYGVFPVRFVILGDPYDTLEIQFEITAERVTHTVLGHQLMFIENTEAALREAFEVVDRYCRLRLPDKFLDAYDSREE